MSSSTQPLIDHIGYSDKYDDAIFEYRHVTLPLELSKRVPKTHRMTETEWRNLGIQMSQGWIHYMIHFPEPHIICFRRKKPSVIENECPVSSQ